MRGPESTNPSPREARATRIDLLIRGGHVLDREEGLDGPADVAITDGRIVAVAPNVDHDAAATTIDARGLIVTAGLIDLHTHVFPDATYWGVDPDSIGPRTGVTTFVDAGSAGAYTLRAFRAFADKRTQSRVVAFGNIAAGGLVMPNFELANIDACDPVALASVAAELGGFVRGVKVRMGIPIALGHGLEPLRRGIAAAEQLGVPLMCHVATAPPSIEEVLAELRPGDIVTHAFTGQSMRLTGDDHRTISAAIAARDAGIILDLGHGSGGFSFESAITLAEAGIYPDTISTDLHQLSVNGPMFDLPTCMTKMLALGMTLPDAVDAATRRPARVVGLSDGTGSLTVGGPADIAIFALDTGDFVLADVHHQTVSARQRLRCVRTIVGGTPVDPRPADPPAPWISLTERQRAYYRTGDPRLVMSDELALADLGPPKPRDVDAGELMAGARQAFGIEGQEMPAVDGDSRPVSTVAARPLR